MGVDLDSFHLHEEFALAYVEGNSIVTLIIVTFVSWTARALASAKPHEVTD